MSDYVLPQISVAFCYPANRLVFSGLMENPLVGKKVKSSNETRPPPMRADCAHFRRRPTWAIRAGVAASDNGWPIRFLHNPQSGYPLSGPYFVPNPENKSGSSSNFKAAEEAERLVPQFHFKGAGMFKPY